MSSEEVIVKGWLVKSPPERKSSRIAWRFVFRAKWRRRYFVLHKPLGSLPGYFALDYYEDETCRRKTGSIDLELTEQIISSLDSSHYAHLFAIKTKFKKKDRTYYLAVDSENEMNKWVECLCQVCGLKPEDVPDVEQPVAQSAESVDGSVEVRTVQPQTGIQMGAQEPDTPSIVDQNHAGSYVRLDDCVSSQNDPVPVSSPEFDRHSVDSIPDTPPPPIPLPVDPSPTTDNAFTFEPNLYSVPPRRPDIPVSEGPQDWYDVPPAHNAVFTSRRDSTSSSAKRDSSARGSTQSTLSEQSSMSGPNEIYDVPPTRYQLDEVATKTGEARISAPEDTYDYPPVRTDNSVTMAPVIPNAPPRRPPRPSPGKPAQIETRLVYENVPPNSRAYPSNIKPSLTECKQRSVDEIYDFPKPQPNNSCLLASPPPGNATSNVTAHNYINASTTVDYDDDDAFAPADNSNNNTKLGNDVFTVVPPANRNGDLHLQALRDSAVNDNIYQIPPSNAPITSARLQVTTRGTPTKKPAAKGTLPEDTYAIFPTARTRSFKKERVPTPPMNRSTKTTAAISEIGIPTPTRIGTDDSSSSDDDDSLSEQLIAKASRRSHANSLTLPHNHKPPQQKKEIQYLDLDLSAPKDEIQYLDLDLQATPEKKVMKRSPKLSKPVTAGNVSPTEYKEIDFLKTHALIETRKTLESEHKRKNSDAISPI